MLIKYCSLTIMCSLAHENQYFTRNASMWCAYCWVHNNKLSVKSFMLEYLGWQKMCNSSVLMSISKMFIAQCDRWKKRVFLKIEWQVSLVYCSNIFLFYQNSIKFSQRHRWTGSLITWPFCWNSLKIKIKLNFW